MNFDKKWHNLKIISRQLTRLRKRTSNQYAMNRYLHIHIESELVHTGALPDRIQ